jgi:hypothetical protein
MINSWHGQLYTHKFVLCTIAVYTQWSNFSPSQVFLTFFFIHKNAIDRRASLWEHLSLRPNAYTQVFYNGVTSLQHQCVHIDSFRATRTSLLMELSSLRHECVHIDTPPLEEACWTHKFVHGVIFSPSSMRSYWLVQSDSHKFVHGVIFSPSKMRLIGEHRSGSISVLDPRPSHKFFITEW